MQRKFENSMNRYRIAFLMLILTVITGLFYLKNREIELHGVLDPERQLKAEKFREAKRSWAENRFQEIAETRLIRESVSAAVISLEKRKVKLNAAQWEQIEHAVQSLLSGLSSRNFEEYLRFRLPVGGYLPDPQRLEWTREALKRANGKTIPENDPVTLFRAYWGMLTEGGNPYVTHISSETVRAAVTYSAQYLGREDIELIDPVGGVFGFQSYHPFFLFSDQPGRQEFSSIPCLLVSFVGRTRAPDDATPLLAKFYWSETNQQWIPFGILVGNAFNRQHAPAF